MYFMWQTTALTVLPILCDITIYYIYLKMFYSCWMQPFPLRHMYGTVCPIVGLWHPYKCYMDHTLNPFRPLMVALEYDWFLQNEHVGQLYG